MTAVLIDACLALLVAVAWLGCLGFVRLRTPLDRLHVAAFVNVGAGFFLVLAAFLADGVSVRACKLLLAVVAGMAGNAALSHAVGRAVFVRGRGEGEG